MGCPSILLNGVQVALQRGSYHACVMALVRQRAARLLQVADAANASSSVGSGVHVVLWSRMLQEFVSVMDGLVPVARPGADRLESLGYRRLS